MYYPFAAIEAVRGELLKNYQEIEVLELGSGSRVHKGSRRKVSSIAYHSLSSAKFSRFLFKTVLFFKPANILELGTSLGVNTLYLAKANPRIPVYTLEGCPQTAAIAQINFSSLQATNIELVHGNINDTLKALLARLGIIDFVYFDANHTFEATLEYFHLCFGPQERKFYLYF